MRIIPGLIVNALRLSLPLLTSLAAFAGEEPSKPVPRYQLEEETKLMVKSYDQLVTVEHVLTKEPPPGLSAYRCQIEKSLGNPIQTDDVYYDTKDGVFRKSGDAVRLRMRLTASLFFKSVVSDKDGVFVRHEDEATLPIDVTKEIAAQAAPWVSGERPNSAVEALRKKLGPDVKLEPVLTIASRRGEILLYPAGGRFAAEYLADVSLDQMTATRNGKSYVFYMCEVELQDRPHIAQSLKPAFMKEAREAAQKLTDFLRKDPRFEFRDTAKNKYQLSWEGLGEK